MRRDQWEAIAEGALYGTFAGLVGSALGFSVVYLAKSFPATKTPYNAQ